ncbi:MAG: hypothetical protein R3A79_27455 [Nannocystaceae bacterium]
MRFLGGRARRGAPLLLSVALLACEGGDGETGTTTSGGGDAPEEFPLPRILDPASETISVPTNRVAPLVFTVNGVVPGVTSVSLTGRSLGTLAPGNELGVMTEETLTLHLGGAMLPGAHHVTLVNPGNAAPLRSRTVNLALLPTNTPAWSLGAAAAFAEGDAMLIDGTFDRALVTIVDEGADDGVAIARVFRRAGDGWDPAARELPLPGYARADDETSPPLSASWSTRIADGDADDRLRLAWRIGQDGQSIVAVDVAWSASDPGAPTPLATAPAPIDAPIEWAAYVRPRFLGGDVILEMLALADSEGARPGDHRLIHVPWPAGASPLAPRPVVTPQLVDLDALGPAFDLLDPARPLLALRYAGLSPALIALDDGGAAQVTRRDEPLGTPANAPVDLLSITTSLGSWSAFAIDADGHYALNPINTLNPAITPPFVVNTVAAPTAAPSLAVFDGIAHVAVPFGDAEVVHVAALGGSQLRLRPLEDLHCDALAFALGDLAATSTELLCLHAGAVTTRTFSASPN